jgi:ABC-type lipoprotein release transport system permease subunit
VSLGQLLSNLLFAVDPIDPTSMMAAGAILGVVALTAAYIPARRATLVQPVQALRAE